MLGTVDCDVIIVGLGPTGAVLANLLGQYGWSVVVIERDEDIYYAPRAVHFDDEIARIFQFAGLADQILATSEPFDEMGFRLKARAKPVMQMNVGSQDRRYGYPGAFWFHQPTLEHHFRKGLQRFPKVRAICGAELMTIVQDCDGVNATYKSAVGETVSLRCRYLIGCDGGKSAVRREAGIELDSADFDQAWVVVDVKARCGKKDPDFPVHHFQVCDPKQPVTFVPMTGPYYEWQFMVMGNKSEREATDPGLVRQQLRKFIDLNKVEIIRIAYYKFHALWARRWRSDRIILAGDSAHQMPPFLGQGMCSGIRDAHALSWRLNLILLGVAAETCLDDYERERTDQVREVINGAMFLGNVIQTRSRIVALIRNFLLFRLPHLVSPLKSVIYALSNRKKPISHGMIGNITSALAGHLMPQPLVKTSLGETVLLDNVLGLNFALLYRTGTSLTALATVEQLKADLSIQVTGFGPSAGIGIVGDQENRLITMFDRHHIDFVLIRPDRYIFDAAPMDQLQSVFANLRQQLLAQPNLKAMAA